MNSEDMFVLGESSEGILTTPNPVAGIPLDQSNESEEKLEALLKRFAPDRFALDIIVCPDSYDSFYFLSTVITDNRFDYIPRPSGDVKDGFHWRDRGGSIVPMQN